LWSRLDMRHVHLCHLGNLEPCNPTAPSYETALHARCESLARRFVACDVHSLSAGSLDVSDDAAKAVSAT